MKLKTRDIPAFLENPPSPCRAVLVYGPDTGLVRERAQSLAARLAGDDPFLLRRISGAQMEEKPHLLLQEAASVPLGGLTKGRAVIRVSGARDAATNGLKAMAEAGHLEAFVILEAGPLSPRSRLRRLAETHKSLAALPCYQDTPAQIRALAQARFRRAEIAIDPHALDMISAHLGNDRGVTESEIEKLILYAGEGGRIQPEDVQASLGKSQALGLEDMTHAVALGESASLARTLETLGNESPVALLSAAHRHFLRLHKVACLSASGIAPSTAIAALKPPLHFSRKTSFERQTRIWSVVAARRALLALWRTNAAIRETGRPDHAMVAQILFAICGQARRRAAS